MESQKTGVLSRGRIGLITRILHAQQKRMRQRTRSAGQSIGVPLRRSKASRALIECGFARCMLTLLPRWRRAAAARSRCSASHVAKRLCSGRDSNAFGDVGCARERVLRRVRASKSRGGSVFLSSMPPGGRDQHALLRETHTQRTPIATRLDEAIAEASVEAAAAARWQGPAFIGASSPSLSFFLLLSAPPHTKRALLLAERVH